jgi:hypothetical protein
MLRDSMEVAIGAGKILLIGFSLYAVVMIAKPEELNLRKDQLGQWWEQLRSESNESNKGSSGSSNYSPEDSAKPDATWDF